MGSLEEYLKGYSIASRLSLDELELHNRLRAAMHDKATDESKAQQDKLERHARKS